jgi:transketolase
VDPQRLAEAIRRTIIEQSRRANVGHIGSALAIADLIAVLYAGELRLDGADRDRLILSKGHAALALYAALELTGRLPAGTLETFCSDGTLLGVHPDRELEPAPAAVAHCLRLHRDAGRRHGPRPR